MSDAAEEAVDGMIDSLYEWATVGDELAPAYIRAAQELELRADVASGRRVCTCRWSDHRPGSHNHLERCAVWLEPFGRER